MLSCVWVTYEYTDLEQFYHLTSLLQVQVQVRTLNLVISSCRLAEYNKYCVVISSLWFCNDTVAAVSFRLYDSWGKIVR